MCVFLIQLLVNLYVVRFARGVEINVWTVRVLMWAFYFSRSEFWRFVWVHLWCARAIRQFNAYYRRSACAILPASCRRTDERRPRSRVSVNFIVFIIKIGKWCILPSPQRQTNMKFVLNGFEHRSLQMQHRIAESQQFFRFNARECTESKRTTTAIEYPFAHLLLHFNKNKISQSFASISVSSRNYGNENHNSSVRRWYVFNGTAAMWRTTYACCIRAIASTQSLWERMKCSWTRVHVCIWVGAINHIAFSFSRAIVRPESVRSVRVYSRDDDTITEPLAMPRNPPNQDYSFRFRSTTFFYSSFVFFLFPALDIQLFLISGRILHAIEQRGKYFGAQWNLIYFLFSVHDAATSCTLELWTTAITMKTL